MPPRDPGALEGAREAQQPKLVKPQLATLVQAPPEGEDWLHEIKFDGYRLIAWIRSGEVRLYTRNGNDWTAKFEPLRVQLAGLPVEEAVLDGELVALDEQGVSSFQALQNALDGAGATLFYYVFDLVHCDGYDLSWTPLIRRKELLQAILKQAGKDLVRYSDHVQGHGHSFYEHACGYGLEGAVSKRADSPYQQKRTSSWVKAKCTKRQEFVVGGYTDPGGSRIGFGALVLGYYDGGRLVHCGRVGTGFDDKLLRRLAAELEQRAQPSSPFDPPPKGAAARGVHWVRPELVAEVAFTGWTDDGVLRHPSFLGLRQDKQALEIRRERPAPQAAQTNAEPPRQGQGAAMSERVTIAGVSLSHPDRVLYPGQGLTKRALAEYYHSVAGLILPHVAGRPLMVLRCPQGQGEECFYQKHVTEALPESIHGVPVEEGGETEEYIALKDEAGLIALVQMGVMEIHAWGSPEADIERPDRIIFDLDPGPGAAWPEAVEAARLLRDRLEGLGLASFVKTSGGKGAHVFVPIRQGITWDQAKGFARGMAESLVKAKPGKYTANMRKDKRPGKVFLDYLRTGRGSTCVVAYSTRARKGAPLSVPVEWEELEGLPGPDAFTVDNVGEWLAKRKADPWQGFFDLDQEITREMLREVVKA